MKRLIRPAITCALLLGGVLISSGTASAGDVITITVDENGNGSLVGPFGNATLSSFILPDPGPGGLGSTLTYDLVNPPGLTAGDVLLSGFEPEIGATVVFDVVRFNPDEVLPNGNVGALVFYSDNVFTFDSLADTPSPPGTFYPNTITIAEVGPEGNNGAFYTPLPGQPGFVTGAAVPVTYHFISDSAVPEPSSLCLLGAGVVSLFGYGVRRWKTAKAVA